MPATIETIRNQLVSLDDEIQAAVAPLRAKKDRLRRELMGLVKRDAGTLDQIIPLLIDDDDAIADTAVVQDDNVGFRLVVLFNTFTDDDSALIDLLETVVNVEYIGSDRETNGKWCEYQLEWKE